MAIWKLITRLTLLSLSISAHAEGGGAKPTHHDSGSGAGSSVPSSIAAEHKELHEKLRRLVGLGGKTGSAAKEVETLLRPHFDKEEKYALPPLRHLSDLAAGKTPGDTAETLRMTEQLKRELPSMLSEHKAVVGALQRLKEAAKTEGRQKGVEFANALEAHATLEEQVLYPSSLLVGRYLKEKGK